MNFQSSSKRNAVANNGFSLLELLVVVTTAAVLTALAVPVLQNASRQYSLRSATTSLASLLQRSRMQSIRTNSTLTVQLAGGNTQVYLDANNSGGYEQGEPMDLLPANITVTNVGAPAIPPGTLGFANPQAIPARFDGRGMPCTFNAGGVCTNFLAGVGEVGFVYYLNQTINGNVRWSAVSISPAGQVKTWSRTGVNWTNI